MTINEKYLDDPVALVPILERARANRQTIVFGNGCFDLLHVGHVRYLQAARALGDLLVIAINTDSSIASNVGREPPINDFAKRAEVMAALAAVDYVIPLEAPTPIPLLELLRPDIQAKGTDYSLEQMPERDTVAAIGGRIEFVGDEKTNSSTALRAALAKRGG